MNNSTQQGLMAKLARFANDSYYLLRTPHRNLTKAKLWLRLLVPFGRIADFDVTHFDNRVLESLYKEIFIRQYYYFRTDTESPVIFDCGANLGMATLYFKWLYPKSRIHAFEPDPSTLAILQKNVSENDLTDVEVHNCALWDKNEPIEFFIDGEHPGSLLMSTDASARTDKVIQVPARKLSGFVNGTIDLLKMDVEGAEHQVLADLISSGKIQSIRQMIIEYHHLRAGHRSRLAGFLNQLEQAGFQYQLHASLWPVSSRNTYQDVLIGAFRE